MAGAVSSKTFLEIALQNRVDIASISLDGDIYDFKHWSMPEMLKVYKLIGECLKNSLDFERVTYETLAYEAADCNVRYREMSCGASTDHLDAGVP